MRNNICILLIITSISQNAICNDTTNSAYNDFYKAQKEFAFDNFSGALTAINKFQKTESFDIYAAKLKLKILSKTRNKQLLNEFFQLVKETGINIDDLRYNALKTQQDSMFFLSKHDTSNIKKEYDNAYKEYLRQLNDPSYAIEIDKILAQDRAARLLSNIINTWEDSLNKYIFNLQMGYVDSLNYWQLKSLIKEKGLPTKSKIGNSQYNLVFMAAMHICVTKSISGAFEFFDSVFVKTVEVGQMNPEFYMFFRDAISRKTENCQIYGYLLFKHSKYGRSLFTFCNENKSYINQIRKEIGAGKIEDACRYERVYCNFKKE